MNALWKITGETGSAIMQSLDSMHIHNVQCLNHDYIPLQKDSSVNSSCAKCQCNSIKSFLLLDGQQNLKVTDIDQFLIQLNCIERDTKVKVVSIFGNTGDGKSHTMNQIFFKGEEVFKTSNDQSSCTLGVWAAFDPVFNVICLDTEGITSYGNGCIRSLLKVLAISDIVIYRTRSERLNKDLFTFLGTASRAYSHHFQAALKAIGQREGISSSLSIFGPSVIVLHETRHTRPLTNNGLESAEDILKTRLAQMKLETEAFSSIKYVGLQTANQATDYELLRSTIKTELNNTTTRSARKPCLVYNTLKTLNDKFSNNREDFSNILFPDQYFTCPLKCLSCSCRCNNIMGHLREGKPHTSNTRCRYQDHYENLIYICKKCYSDGNEVEVSSRLQAQNESSWYSLARYAWSGYIIECPHCGEIYRSRQYWYGNKNPEDDAVRAEVTHVWNTQTRSIVSQNTAQRVIDGVSYITEAVTNVSLQPTKTLSAWVADQVAPSYWRPNNEIKHCHKCKILFGSTDTKHHCRDCGEGFCELCSSQTKCVPSRNWYTPVRVCDACYVKDANSNDELAEFIEDVSIRKVTEHVVSTLSVVGSVLHYSKSFIKDSVRPSYWIPDSEIVNCCVCDQKFSTMLPLHHCRDCGRGVCQECSQHRKPVAYRGWDKPVRVCDICVNFD